ncbi:hypothetical protein BU251_00235 [Candidatus Velamenicoccus archaeovorus]|uniref:Uncharacterized protein n=1 Tax=Velamenicoccus archaeovorus TaxID=1930593 RepID=A0A410P2B0_VELA1|nr:hypothetical protein BU251_00235 [Candidatus Velamenicoccus archaeovorus]
MDEKIQPSRAAPAGQTGFSVQDSAPQKRNLAFYFSFINPIFFNPTAVNGGCLWEETPSEDSR